MRKAAAATAGAVALAAVSAGGGYVFRIAESRGGNVAAFVNQYDDLRARGVPVRVDGVCNSSCTMVLGYSNACLGPRAVLGFHPAYVPLYFFYILDWPDTRVMLAHYPPDARAVINRHGRLDHDPGGAWDNSIGAYPKLFYVKGEEFPAHYQCGP